MEETNSEYERVFETNNPNLDDYLATALYNALKNRLNEDWEEEKYKRFWKEKEEEEDYWWED